jgi:SpoIID/LytB domain protein
VRIAVGIGISVCLLSLALSRGLLADPTKITAPTAGPNPAEEDARLQEVAQSALGHREGAIVIIDPQTGRVRAVVNPRFAFQYAFPPGSTIKPFTVLTALRSGVINRDSRTLCRAQYKHEDVNAVCSHDRNLAPLNPTEAIAHSCNYYFSRVGERLEEGDLNQTLADFGFGGTTGINGAESAGVLLRGEPQLENAIGEGRFVQVTPIQLLTAYTALLNGGKLLQPALAPAANFTPRVRSQVRIDDAERSILLEGMRGAVRFGTAKNVHLDSLPAYVVGKTGTSTPLQGFRFHGWFVGFAFAPDRRPEPSNARLGVIVFLQNGHGSDAAQVARSIFEEFFEVKKPKKSDTSEVSVHQVTENITHRMSLEDYILRVTAVEGGVEDETEALKALAIAARTYALKNLGRHAKDGYDFCSTTHCQRFESTHPTRPAVVAAVKATAGLVLRDEQGQVADSYFGASCGGMTANLKTLWGANAPKYLSGVRDDYCDSGGHSHWTDVIPGDRLAHALRSDPRTDVGETIRELSVAREDQTGRAELISIVGDRKRVINGWEFKLIVGRSLGWNVLKSSRFTISRSGSAFVFRGSGFGHGLGLCQEGAHVMAQRQSTFRQILANYFPGTHLEPQIRQISLRSEHFQVTLPQTDHAQELLGFLESSRVEILRRASSSGIELRMPNVEIVFNATTGDFTGRTGMPAWAAAATRNNRIELQPLRLLKQRRILETTLRHELVHVVIDSLGGKQTPRWLAEGMALHVAGEGKLLQRSREGKQPSPELVEQTLASVKSAAEMQAAYATAYNLVRELIRNEGENKVWKRLAERNYSVSSVLR